MSTERDAESVRDASTRFEFRVWGRHERARERLEAMASEVTEVEVDDWYLLGDDPDLNAKIRGDAVKLKRLVGRRKGFERWTRERFHDADGAPRPFDHVIDELPLDARGASRRRLRKALRRLDPSLGLEPVHVRKRRRIYTVGDVRAEVTRIHLVESDAHLHTIVIEGPDLDALVALRKSLGLRGEPNVAVHRALAQKD